MLLAGDVGGTKTTLGLFEPARPRPRAVATQTYATREFEGFTEILAGIKSGDVVVTEGSFVLKSEFAKASLSEEH